MAQGVNRVILVGNLGIDPVMREVQGGGRVCRLRIATSENWKGKDHTEWHQISVFAEAADACAKYLRKGRMVYVEGRLRFKQWTDKDGNKRGATEVHADRVLFLGSVGGKPERTPSAEEAPAPLPVEPSPPADADDDEIPF